MDFVELTWLYDEDTLKEALKKLQNFSGQHIKSFFNSKEQNRKIRKGDLIRLPLDFINHNKINPRYLGPSIKILKETKEYIAIHKPSLIHCHPLQYSDQNTVLNFLCENKLLDALLVNESNYDRGLMYRLDYETSGVLLLAKDQKLYESLRKSFDTLMKGKYYLAIVEGSFNKEGEWSHYFEASGPGGSKQKVFEDYKNGARIGKSLIKKVLEKNGKSLVLIKLETGLRHQIRAQLAYLGFPIVGDEHYGGVKSHRLYLHAYLYQWNEEIFDVNLDLFHLFFDLNSALQMTNDVISTLKGC